MSTLTVVAKIVAKNDSLEIVKSELRKLVAPSRKEDGCIYYCLHQDSEDPCVFIFYETWESLDHLQRHTNTDHYMACLQAVGDKVSEKTVHKMTRIE